MDIRDTAWQRRERGFTVEDDDGTEHVLPTKYEVCLACAGRGSHVNPSIDAHGISPEEFAEDPDFEEAYFGGRYDQPCNECRGERVVLTVDEEACSPRLAKLWVDQGADLAAMHAEMEAERRMGA